jgi:hypothetical protein
VRRIVSSLLVSLLAAGGLIALPQVMSPASAATHVFGDTAMADFNAGNAADSMALNDSGDGAIQMAPGSASFNGTSLPEDWTFDGSGSATVSGGHLHVDEGRVNSPVFLTAGYSLTFRASLVAPGQFIGFGSGDNLTSGFFYGLQSYSQNGNTWLAMRNGQSSLREIPRSLPSFTGAPHTFKVVRGGGMLTVYVLDDPNYSTTPLAQVSLQGVRPLPVQISDGGNGATLAVDSLRVELVPDASTDFSTPPAWELAPAPAPAWTIAGGTASLDSTNYKSQAAYQPSVVADFRATMNASPTRVGNDKSIGLQASHPTEGSSASFQTYRASAGASWTLRVIVDTPGAGCTVVVPGFDPTAAAHDYRIEISSKRATFTILDVPSVAPISCAGSFTSAASAFGGDVEGDGQPLVLDSVSVTHAPPYVNESFESPLSGWVLQPRHTGGVVATVASGQMTVNEGYANTASTFTPGHSVEFWATFSGGVSQEVGFTQNAGAVRATISTGTTAGSLYAYGDGVTVQLPSSLLGSSHHYRIDWNPTTYTFHVLDAPSISPIVINHGATGDLNMSVGVRDWNNATATTVVDSVKILPLSASANSRVFDSGGVRQTWKGVTYTASTPANTSAEISVRAGDTPSPDASWTSWVPIANSGDEANVIGRYAQYKIAFSSSDDWAMPSVSEVTLTSEDLPIDLGDTTNAHFAAGEMNDTDLAYVGDGALSTLSPIDWDPNATTVDPSWTATTPSGLTMNNGAMHIVGTDAVQLTKGYTTVPDGQILTFEATFTGTQDQSFGIKEVRPAPGNQAASAYFEYSPSTQTLRAIVVPVGPSASPIINSYSLNLTGQTHTFGINWSGNGFVGFDFDGNRLTPQVGSVDSVHIGMPAGQWTPWVADPAADSDPLIISDEYFIYVPPSGWFYSRIIGNGNVVYSGDVDWNADVPSGTSMIVEVRSGDTYNPDSTWSGWQTIANGDPLPTGGHFVQYRVTMNSTPPSAHPVLRDITFSFLT